MREVLRLRLVRKLLLAFVVLLFFASLASAQGAMATEAARRQAAGQAAANLGVQGPGPDLRAIASPRQQPQTLTGFPAGTLPGSTRGGVGESTGMEVVGKAVLSGQALPPIIGEGMIGETLDHVCAVVAHVGYTIVRRADVTNSLDAFYMFDVMSGRNRRARLYFDRSMKVLRVEN